jgi:hypothetical protein
VPPQRSLTDAQALQVLARLASGETGRSIARSLDVADMVISNIRRGYTYTHLPRPAGLAVQADGTDRSGAGPAARALAEAMFWTSVDRSNGADACWPWTGPCNNNGYGMTGLRLLPGGRTAFRVAYLLANRLEQVPPRIVVRHLCGYKACCNPAHLLAGTKQDNYRDGLAVPGGKPVIAPVRPPAGGWNIPTETIADLEVLEAAEQFWKRAQRTGDAADCWNWSGARGPLGHGNVRWRGRTTSTARVAYELCHGRKPLAGLVVRHTCDNGACCNPAHLVLGTQRDNRADAVERGRVPAGEAHHYGRQTPDATVRRAREAHREGSSLTVLARECGVSISTVSNWVRGTTRLAAGGLIDNPPIER